MIRPVRTLSLLFLVMSSSVALSHGEDKPGPNGGAVRMPGGFHTEVIKNDKIGFKVFLLDMNFLNPTIENSTVEATVLTKDKATVSLGCKPSSNHFLCTADRPEQLVNAQKLQIKAKRKDALGAWAIYPLPLK